MPYPRAGIPKAVQGSEVVGPTQAASSRSFHSRPGTEKQVGTSPLRHAPEIMREVTALMHGAKLVQLFSFRKKSRGRENCAQCCGIDGQPHGRFTPHVIFGASWRRDRIHDGVNVKAPAELSRTPLRNTKVCLRSAAHSTDRGRGTGSSLQQTLEQGGRS